MVTLAIGAVGSVTFLLTAAFAPLLTPYDPTAMTGPVWQSASALHFLGTDNLGRDMLSRLIQGCRITVALALAATLVSFTVGTLLGLLAAASTRWLDTILSRLVDATVSLPTLLIALMALSVIGSSITTMIAVIGLIDSTRVFRLARAVGISVMSRDFVEVAALRGEGILWIMRKEIFPNITGVLVSEFAIRFGFTILTVSALSFLGLGIQPPETDWGSMVRENAVAINMGLAAPVIPALAIALLSVSVNLFADGLPGLLRRIRGAL